MLNTTINLERYIAELLTVGLSRQEATVYLTLLQFPGLTGYRVAQKIGKSAANVYKILQTLEGKGIILGSRGKNPRSYAAIPISEFIGGYKRKLEARLASLEDSFRDFEPEPVQTGGIYPLKDMSQVWDKARDMIARAEQVVVVSRLGELPAEFRQALVDVRARGVDVVAKVSDDDPLPGCHVVHGMGGIRWGIPADVEWLDVLIDGRESLISFDDRGNLDAFWTDNLLLSFNIYNGSICEYFLQRLSEEMNMDDDSGFFPQLRDVNHLRASSLPAFRELVFRLNSAGDEG